MKSNIIAIVLTLGVLSLLVFSAYREYSFWTECYGEHSLLYCTRIAR